MESGFKKRNPVKTFPMKDEIGVFCRCVLLYTKLPGKTSTPLLDVQLYAGEVHDIVKSVCKISRKNLASGQTQQNFSFIQAAKGRRSGEARRKGTPLELDRAPWEAEGASRATWYRHQAGQHTGQHGGARRFSSETEPKQDD